MSEASSAIAVDDQRRSRDFRSLWFGESVSLLGDLAALGERRGPVVALTLCSAIAALSLSQLSRRRIRTIRELPLGPIAADEQR